jgi:hypothetical protein
VAGSTYFGEEKGGCTENGLVVESESLWKQEALASKYIFLYRPPIRGVIAHVRDR